MSLFWTGLFLCKGIAYMHSFTPISSLCILVKWKVLISSNCAKRIALFTEWNGFVCWFGGLHAPEPISNSPTPSQCPQGRNKAYTRFLRREATHAPTTDKPVGVGTEHTWEEMFAGSGNGEAWLTHLFHSGLGKCNHELAAIYITTLVCCWLLRVCLMCFVGR